MPAITTGQTNFLADLITDFLVNFKQEYPECRLTAKFHYLSHYPNQIRQFGPLRNLWTLRFEAKHQQFKNTFKLNKCHKNICKSLARRHQVRLSLASDDVNFFSLQFEYSRKLHIENILNLPGHEQDLIKTKTPDLLVQRFKTLKFGNSLFTADKTCIVVGKDGDKVLFSKLMYFFNVHGCPYAMCRRLNTVDYLAHFHAFVVEECPEVFLKDVSQMLSQDQYLGMYHISITLEQCVVLQYHI